MIYNVLTIAGSDSGGGAGIQADLKAISARGCYGLSVITALTAQNTVSVDAIYPIAIDFISAQCETVARDIRIDAIKVGMLGTVEVTDLVSAFLATQSCPIVVDPVMVAKSGDRLLHRDAVEALRQRLLPLATVITPNLPEAADLLGVAEATDDQSMLMQARALQALGARAVLLKGGHLLGDQLTDLLLTDRVDWFRGPRIQTHNTHGTGCSLSAALAAELTKSQDLLHAVQVARGYLTEAIRHSDALSVGSGHGPVHHFWEQTR